MDEFLKFKKMITPIIIQIIFWVGVISSVISGVVMIITGDSYYGEGGGILIGLLFIFLGPIVVRIYCEFLILFFSINDTLTDIKKILGEKNTS